MIRVKILQKYYIDNAVYSLLHHIKWAYFSSEMLNFTLVKVTLDGITDSMDVSLSELWELVMDGDCVLQFMGSQGIGHNWATELNWTEMKDPPDPQTKH